ncbi:hypothetical protein [Streptomyces sp. MA5143a]|uniref:hypothetical protein n=1 Tax=Streptomyces sp. MA5143a TaxID=2083010 RepID=UPI000D29E3E9|nr:hypothetical protein [Streptomyces sp. MA5143a]SPF07061.1 hypothetical protein SMA5143A_7905 [Streptomyces sp. MA5143a]
MSKHAPSKGRRAALTAAASASLIAVVVALLPSANADEGDTAQPLKVLKSSFAQLFPDAQCLVALNQTTREFANVREIGGAQAPGTKDLIDTQISASTGDELMFFAVPQADCNAADNGKVTIDRLAEKLPGPDGVVVDLSREGTVTRR